MNFDEICKDTNIFLNCLNNIYGGGQISKNEKLNNVTILGPNSFEVDLPFIIDIDYTDFNNPRESIKQKIEERYLNRVYYIFYIKEINFDPILNGLLPLIQFNRGEEKLNIALRTKIFVLYKNQNLECKILIKQNDYITAQTDFALCKILPSNSYSTVNIGNTIYILLENDKKIYHNTNAIVKIVNIKSSNLGETDKIICDAEFVVDK